MQPTRRQFIRHSSGAIIAGSALSAAPFVLAQDKSGDPAQPKPTLVVIYLRGGADPLQVLVPYGDPLYYRVRPTIAVPGPAALPGAGAGDRGAAPLNDYFGLHPAMRPLHDLFREGRIAPILSVGSPHPTRSHFDAQDFMERAAPGTRHITEGWLSRYLTHTRTNHESDLRGVSFQPVLPRSLRGEYPVLAVPGYGMNQTLDVFEKLYVNCDEERSLNQKQAAEVRAAQRPSRAGQAVPAAHPPIDGQTNQQTILAAGSRAIARLRELDRIIREGTNSATYPPSGFGTQLSHVARLIKADRGVEVTALDYHGWDHHAFQGGAEGTMANMLADLAGSLRAFSDDLGPRMERTLVLVMSEFGRTVHENGNNGSDHGRGGFMLAMGGMVNGRRLYGRWTGLDRENLIDRRDLPVHTDFRLVFAEALERLFGFDALGSEFFPGFARAGKMLDYLRQV